jgi:hypothetical protein
MFSHAWKLAALMIAVPSLALMGCEREGPAERAGRDIDRAGERTGEAIEDLGEEIQDASRDWRR